MLTKKNYYNVNLLETFPIFQSSEEEEKSMEFNKEEFKKNLSARLRRQYGKDISQANKHDLFDAVSASAFELIMPNWMATRAEYEKKPTKQLY